MKYDYINIVNFRLHDDYTGIRWSECGDNNIFIDGNGNGPYDFRFSKVRKYYFYGELPEKYILNITTGDFRNAPENGIFKTIKSNHRILKDLKDGNAKILINRIGEFDTFINGKLSDSEYTTLIHNLFKSGVNKSNILYLNFNSIVEEAMCNSDIKSRYHNFTMLNLYSIIKDKEGKYREIFEKQKNSLREYYYLCYNNSSKPHRRKIVSYLLEKKFKGLLSSTEYNIFLDDAIPYAGNPERDSGWSGRNGNLYYYANKKHFYNSYFSIITESSGDFILRYMSRVYTEKTWKVITNFHPFLLVGTLDSIKGLQEMGFETFPEMFDESYDSEAALEDKLPKICNQIEKVCLLTQSQLNNVYCSMEEKLVYNFHHFFRLCENEIDELEKYLLKFCNS